MIIKQNFLNSQKFNTLKDSIFSNHFPLFYQDGAASKEDKSDFMFTHLFFYNGKQNSSYFNILDPLLSKIKIKNLIRVKLNFYTKKDKHIYTAFHKDYDIPHKVALFSLNTCNGFTYFKDSKEKVKSIENQILLFNGKEQHCSVSQTDENIRVNININYN
jgi:hypothetical protein